MSPSRRVLRGEQAVEAVLRLRRPEEEDRWVRVKSLPVSVKDGKIALVVSIIHDLGEERIARNAEFMTRAGTILSSSLNYESTLAGLAQLTVPEIERIVERGVGALQAGPPRPSLPPDEPEKQGLSPSRVAALDNLAKHASGSVSLGELADLFRTTCCACGAQDLPTYCTACPMLDLVNRVLACAESH